MFPSTVSLESFSIYLKSNLLKTPEIGEICRGTSTDGILNLNIGESLQYITENVFFYIPLRNAVGFHSKRDFWTLLDFFL